MLTAHELKRQVAAKRIIIEPFNEAQVNPNSYNVRLGNELGVYVPAYVRGYVGLYEHMAERMAERFDVGDELPPAFLDCRKANPLTYLTLPPRGAVLYPGKLYLGATVERTETPYHIPIIEGRSSLARLGIKVHVTAGFGDIGFAGHWTLEIEVTEPVRIYPHMEFAQISFTEPTGLVDQLYQGKYQNTTQPTASRIHKELSDDPRDEQCVRRCRCGDDHGGAGGGCRGGGLRGV